MCMTKQELIMLAKGPLPEILLDICNPSDFLLLYYL